MKLEKTLVKKTFTEVSISQWIKPEGYKLAMCALNLPAFKITLNLFFGEFNEFKRFLKEESNFETNVENCIAAVASIQKDGIVYHNMIIQQNDWTCENYNTIVHELHHFTHFALKHIGVNYSDDSEECYAYIQGYFMELVCRAFLELKKSKVKML